MQSGVVLQKKNWFLSIQSSAQNNIDQGIILKFNSLDDAVCYAQKNKFDFKIVEPPISHIIRRNYADNFTKKN